MQYLPLVIVLILILLLAYGLSQKYKTTLNRNEHFAEFVIAIVATAFGVFLGMYAARLEAQRSERNAAIALVEKSRVSVRGWIDDIENTYELCRLTNQDSMKVAITLTLTPLRTPSTVDVLLRSELALRHLSTEGFAQLLSLQNALDGTAEALNRRSASNRKLAPNIDVLGMMASEQAHWLDAEWNMLTGSMNDAQRHAYAVDWAIKEQRGANIAGSWAYAKANPMQLFPSSTFHGSVPDSIVH